MTKFITILISCSLAFAAGVKAEQENANENPKNKQKAKTEQKQQFTPKQHTAPNTHVQSIHPQQNSNLNNARVRQNNISKQQLNTLPAVQSNKVQTRKLNTDRLESNRVQAERLQTDQLSKKMQQTEKLQTSKVPLNKQTLHSFHPKHLDFHAQPKSAIASAQFNQNFHIKGSENWKNNHLQVFRSYHPQWHDQGWWHSHHHHLSLIGGGWYYWDGGYWYPAWGYDTNAAYYPYDGPIYVGNNATPFDQIVADVQSTLQEQGYYKGEVDGLVGPLTQQALADYQRDHGLDETAAVDEPTLASLGLA